jgi:SAM-dependent MidA family methyltransferase
LEVSPAACAWWQSAAQQLTTGSLLTLDYGLETEQFLEPGRSTGTLRAYSRHQSSRDLLASPGERDLTAHVNFTHIRQTGDAAGLRTTQWASQSAYLTALFKETLSNQSGFPTWTPARIRQFQTLIHPEHLGRAFRVLEQSKERPERSS